MALPLRSLLLTLFSSACLAKANAAELESSPFTIFSMLLSSLSEEAAAVVAPVIFGDSVADLSDLGDTEGDLTSLVECRLGLEGLEPPARLDRPGSTASKADAPEALLERLGGTSGSGYGAKRWTPEARDAAFRWWWLCGEAGCAACWWLLSAWYAWLRNGFWEASANCALNSRLGFMPAAGWPAPNSPEVVSSGLATEAPG